MKFYRIKISSWTASFRYPNIISGYQPTLDVPPVGTVLGLMNACSGKYLRHTGLNLGYYFDYGAKAVDLETIYQVEGHEKGFPKNAVKSNIMNREFLYDCRLFVYVEDLELVSFFRNPYFQLLLGRSGDLATVESVEEVDLPLVERAEHIRGQVVPFKGHFLPGVLQALPKYFTDTIPRRNIGTEAYTVISHDDMTGDTGVSAFRDVIDGKEVDIYLHKLLFEHEGV